MHSPKNRTRQRTLAWRENDEQKKSERKKVREEADMIADAAGVQLVRLHRDTQTKAIRSLVGIAAPVCVCM